jgi:hypothetical protein
VTQPLMGLAEIRVLFRLSTYDAKLLTARTSFPKPVAVLAMGSVWTTHAVQQWAKATGHDVTDPTARSTP